MKYVSLILVLMLVLVSYGCPPKAVQPYSTGPQPYAGPSTTMESDRARAGGITEEELAARERMERERMLAEAEALRASSQFKDIRFDFDSYAIKAEYTDDLTRTGEWLKRNGSVTLLIEGHTDERGTIEYNMVLGQKRAEAVKGFLAKLGVAPARLKTISYGKEMPLDPGSNEDAWAKNRRVHFTVDGKR